MKAKKILSLMLSAALMLSMAAAPALAVSLEEELLPAAQALELTNEPVSIQLQANGDLVYGSPLEITVKTKPEGTQYIGVVMGTKGEAKGYVTLMLSDKYRTLLKLIPLPKKMSANPDQEEEFNVYDYLRQLINGNDVGVLLRVADEVVSVMDVLKFYAPALNDVASGLKLALNLIRCYLPEDAFTRIYLDEQPTDAGSYIAGAVALGGEDLNTAGVAAFTIKPRSEGVRMYWASDVPATITVEQAASMEASAVTEVDGQVYPGASVSYTYKKTGLFGTTVYAEPGRFPTEPGEYIQTAKLGGNYSCANISRTIKVVS
ncbi:MAG: hypothetical protein ACI4JC_09380 [Faecalibacterium sp.]